MCCPWCKSANRPTACATVEARLRGRPGTGWDAAGLMNAPLDHPVSGFPLSDDLLPWVGSGPRHDIGVLGRVERPRSTAADQGWSALTRCNRQAETWDLKAFQSPSQSSGFPLSVAPSSRLAAEWWPRGRGTTTSCPRAWRSPAPTWRSPCGGRRDPARAARGAAPTSSH
jgi:hypothetical protein